MEAPQVDNKWKSEAAREAKSDYLQAQKTSIFDQIKNEIFEKDQEEQVAVAENQVVPEFM